MPSDKDAAILDLLARLGERLGPGVFEVVDHWDDPCAVGLARPSDPRVLAYVAWYDDPEKPYYVELELPPISGDDFPYQVAGRYDRMDFEAVVGVVKGHLESSERGGAAIKL